MHMMEVDTILSDYADINTYLHVKFREPTCLSGFDYHSDKKGEEYQPRNYYLLGLLQEANAMQKGWLYFHTRYDCVGHAMEKGAETSTWQRTGIWTMRAELRQLRDHTEPTVFSCLQGSVFDSGLMFHGLGIGLSLRTLSTRHYRNSTFP
jgi:hypothetical protein